MTQQHEPDTARCIQRIADVADAITTNPEHRAPASGRDQALQAAIDHARDRGVSWQTIGAALGMRRGAAYQRYRHRPTNAVVDRTNF